MMASAEAAPDPRRRQIPPHVKQTYNWDCGLACVLMVVHAQGMRHVDLRYLRDLCGTTSIWTVDIAYMLRHFGVPVRFLTTTLGANPLYAEETFYKDHMRDDERRVERLFRGAQDAGIQIDLRKVSLEELRELVAAHLVIILVDKGVLQGSARGSGGGLLCAQGMCCGIGMASGSKPGAGYVGHYLLLHGHDPKSGEFLARDPASPFARSRIKEARLDAARKSFGTDQDMVLVPWS